MTSMAALAKLKKEDPDRLKNCVVTAGLSLGEYDIFFFFFISFLFFILAKGTLHWCLLMSCHLKMVFVW